MKDDKLFERFSAHHREVFQKDCFEAHLEYRSSFSERMKRIAEREGLNKKRFYDWAFRLLQQDYQTRVKNLTRQRLGGYEASNDSKFIRENENTCFCDEDLIYIDGACYFCFFKRERERLRQKKLCFEGVVA